MVMVLYVFFGCLGVNGVGVVEVMVVWVMVVVEELNYWLNSVVWVICIGCSGMVQLLLYMLSDLWFLVVVDVVNVEVNRYGFIMLIFVDGDWYVVFDWVESDVVYFDGVGLDDVVWKDFVDFVCCGQCLVVFFEYLELDGFDVICFDVIFGCEIVMDYLLEWYIVIGCIVVEGVVCFFEEQVICYMLYVEKFVVVGIVFDLVWMVIYVDIQVSVFIVVVELLLGESCLCVVYVMIDFVVIVMINVVYMFGFCVLYDVVVVGVGNILDVCLIVFIFMIVGLIDFYEWQVCIIVDCVFEVDLIFGCLYEFVWMFFFGGFIDFDVFVLWVC